MQQLRKISLLFFMFIVIGCNTTEESYDTSGFQTIDNSELSPFYNAYGYYGDEVIFGETIMVGIWVLYDTDSDGTIYTNFYDDGSGVTSDGVQFSYGVSQSGLSLNLSTGDAMVITTSEIYKEVDDFDCYRVKISGASNSTVDMCPDH